MATLNLWKQKLGRVPEDVWDKVDLEALVLADNDLTHQTIRTTIPAPWPLEPFTHADALRYADVLAPVWYALVALPRIQAHCTLQP